MPRRLPVLLILLSLVAVTWASTDALERLQGDTNDNGYDDGGKKWREDIVKVPPLPEDDDLAKVDIPAPSGMTAYVGKSSLSVSDTDGITRYWLIVSSPQGGYNATFEGLECSSLRYRVLGYGSKRRNKVVAARGTRWRHVREDPFGQMHADLAEYYLCAPGQARSLETVIDVLNGKGVGHHEVGRDL